MTGWHEGPLAAFDLETTGVDIETARIVTACVIRIDAARQIHERNWLADPGIAIPAEATAIHGITTEHARSAGMPAAQAVGEIIAEIAAIGAEGVPLVIYNAPYDLSVLDRELHRHYGVGLPALGPVIDPLVLDRRIDRQLRGSRALDPNSEHYRVRLDSAHDAREDAIAAARMAWRIASLYPELATMDLGALMALQADAHEQWAIRLTDYWRSTGRGDVAEGHWPLHPYVAEAVAS